MRVKIGRINSQLRGVSRRQCGLLPDYFARWLSLTVSFVECLSYPVDDFSHDTCVHLEAFSSSSQTQVGTCHSSFTARASPLITHVHSGRSCVHICYRVIRAHRPRRLLSANSDQDRYKLTACTTRLVMHAVTSDSSFSPRELTFICNFHFAWRRSTVPNFELQIYYFSDHILLWLLNNR